MVEPSLRGREAGADAAPDPCVVLAGGAGIDRAPDWAESDVRTLLAKFGLVGHHATRPAASLSPGATCSKAAGCDDLQ